MVVEENVLVVGETCRNREVVTGICNSMVEEEMATVEEEICSSRVVGENVLVVGVTCSSKEVEGNVPVVVGICNSRVVEGIPNSRVGEGVYRRVRHFTLFRYDIT
ncbi:hypothetical protein SLE2022_085070 [Rubroshorea leprosula]